MFLAAKSWSPTQGKMQVSMGILGSARGRLQQCVTQKHNVNGNADVAKEMFKQGMNRSDSTLENAIEI